MQQEREIVRMVSGSRVYGTTTPDSDTDIKYVFVPSVYDIIMQRAPNQHQTKTNNKVNQKNTKDDIDIEGFSLQFFLNLVARGQTLAIEMLFTPEEFIIHKTPTWEFIIGNRNKLVTSKLSSFVGYCRTQFAKYCLKSERLKAVNDVVDFLSGCNQKQKIEDVICQIQELTIIHKGIVIVDTQKSVLIVCDRQAQFGLKIDSALAIYKKVQQTYGDRSIASMKNNSTDLKALYHAVRLAKEAEELISTGFLTFPRPDADLLLKIRKGEVSIDEASELIDDSLTKIEKASENACLPSEPNINFINDFVFNTHLEQINKT